MKNGFLYGKLKLLCLKTRRAFHAFFNGFFYKLSFLFVLFSFLVSLWLLLPDLFDRAPIFPYFTQRLELPLTYEMRGSVKIVDREGNIINDSITISVGGYRERIGANTDYDLCFSSPKQDSFFVTITYKDQKGIERIYTEKVSFPDGSNVFREDYVIDC